MNRDFKGIWIPKEIWLSKELTTQEKLFLVEIHSLDNNEGCFAGNGYFSEFFSISKTRVSLVIKSLIEKGFITSTIIYKDGTKQILKRVLKESYTPYLTKIKDPIQQKLKDNNTVSNTTNNTFNKLPKKVKTFSEDVYNCYDNCLFFFNENLHPNDEKKKYNWLNTIEQLNRIDKIPFELIVEITKKAKADDFWSSNFSSITKLRKKNNDDVMYIIFFYNKFCNQIQNKPNTASDNLLQALIKEQQQNN